MIERRCGERLAPQPLARDGVVLAAGMKKLDGDAALQTGIVRKEDFTHPTGAKRRKDAVPSCEEIHANFELRTWKAEGKFKLHFSLPSSNFQLSYLSSSGLYRCGYSGPMYSARGRISLLFAYCSSTCAVQPEIRLTAKIGVNRSMGMPSAWYVVAE